MLFNGVYVLWEDPLIVSCQGPREMHSSLSIPRPADILLHPTWLITPRSLPKLFYYRWQSRRLGKKVHFMCNADESNRLLRRLRLPGDLASINCYINEQVFCIIPEKKQYDAVYAARMVPYKRLHLAAKVNSLFVQTYGDCRTPDGAYDLHRYEPRIKHCSFNRSWVSNGELVSIYNRARVGLSLSKVEGAMLASVEYMLCGLPQVSTGCRGGREQFFDDRYVAVVNATSEAVATGVKDLIARKVDPHFVRSETLKKIQIHRERMCDYIINIIRQHREDAPSRDALLNHLFGNEKGIYKWFVQFKDYRMRHLA